MSPANPKANTDTSGSKSEASDIAIRRERNHKKEEVIGWDSPEALEMDRMRKKLYMVNPARTLLSLDCNPYVLVCANPGAPLRISCCPTSRRVAARLVLALKLVLAVSVSRMCNSEAN